MVGVCYIQGAKYVKCNSPYLTKHHHFAWCCKANNKINPPRLEIKKDKPCPHSFKYLNCRGEHQADLYDCPFWKHCFNKKWHTKEYTKIQNNWRNLTHSAVNRFTIWFWRTWRYSHKMFERITSSLTLFLKSIKALILYSSKNHCRLHSELFPAQQIVKAYL